MIQYNDIQINCAATKIHIDLTGGWKSALLLYMCAMDINENQTSKTSIVPSVVTRINRYNVESMNRPDAVEIVKRQLEWIKNIFPTVKIDPMISIPADFWWIPDNLDENMSIDVSEKALLRYVYELCTNTKIFPVLKFIDGLPKIKNFNAYCRESTRVEYITHVNTIPQKKYQYGNVLNNSTVSLCDGNVIATQPFSETTKSNLVSIAKNLHIFDELMDVSYTCEQNTVEYKDLCGICFNCLQMKRALDNYDQNA